MASPSVHDATGKKCGVCGLIFTRTHFNISITKERRKADPFHEKVKACKTCANEYFSRGEV